MGTVLLTNPPPTHPLKIPTPSLLHFFCFRLYLYLGGPEVFLRTMEVRHGGSYLLTPLLKSEGRRIIMSSRSAWAI